MSVQHSLPPKYPLIPNSALCLPLSFSLSILPPFLILLHLTLIYCHLSFHIFFIGYILLSTPVSFSSFLHFKASPSVLPTFSFLYLFYFLLFPHHFIYDRPKRGRIVERGRNEIRGGVNASPRG